MRKWQRENRARYNAYTRDYLRRRYHERWPRAIALLGGACVTCGSVDELQFDHVDPVTKFKDVTTILAQWAWDRVLTELEKCQLLCFPCHIDKTLVDNTAPEWSSSTTRRS